MLLHRRLILFITTVLLVSCNQGTNKPGVEPLAKVGEHYLYRSDLPVNTGENLSPQDSQRICQSFIEKWIKKQLLLEKAELNLPEGEQDVSTQLEEYRASLLIYKYQQMLLKQQLDTVVTREQVENYYQEHNSGYTLNKPALRGEFLQVRRPAPDLDKVRSWCRSEQPEAKQSLEKYCRQYAHKFELFTERWVDFETIRNYFPSKNNTGEWILKAYKLYEIQDTSFVYILSIKEYRLAGTPTPLDIVENNIRSIILNKRKIEFLHNIEKDIYTNALNRKLVEYYTK